MNAKIFHIKYFSLSLSGLVTDLSQRTVSLTILLSNCRIQTILMKMRVTYTIIVNEIIFQVMGFNYVLAKMFPLQSMITTIHNTTSTASRLKDAAKSASDLAKSKAVPIYAKLHPNQS